jgi:ferredoxin
MLTSISHPCRNPDAFMPDPRDKLPENVPGRYYVDSQCIDCEVCRDIAPDNFKRKKEKRYLFVFKQPENRIEDSLIREAMAACPVEAIGETE